MHAELHCPRRVRDRSDHADAVRDDRAAIDGAGVARPLGACWLGIATDAFDRARAFVRASAKGRPEAAQPLALRLSHLMTDLALLRAEVGSGLRDFTDASETDRERLTTMATILRFNNLKLAASEHAPKICQGALGVTGIVGFKNDTPFSVGRHIRDSMSASLMVANERIHQTNASLLLIAKDV